MNFSRLRNLCTFEEDNETADASGWKQEEDWRNIGTDPITWCLIEPLSAREQWESDQARAKAVVRVTVRGRDDINTGKTRLRVTLRGVEKIYYVSGQKHEPDEIDDWLVMSCDENPVE